MAHDTSYTRLYIDSVNGIGIGVHEVAKCLGRGTLDVGQLCADVDGNGAAVGKINKWAKYKPVRLNKWSALTDADYASVNYGFDVTQTSGTVAKGGIDALTILMNYAMQHGDAAWEYLPPRGLNANGAGSHEQFRILDFDGYNSSARAPYSAPVNATLTGADRTLVDYVIKENINVEIDVTQMSAFTAYDGDNGDMHLGVLVKSNKGLRLYLLNTEYTDLFNDEQEEDVTINIYQGNNHCQYVFTDIPLSAVDSNGVINAEANLEDCVTIALPNTYHIYTLSSIANAILVSEGWQAQYFFKVVMDGGDVTEVIPACLYTNTTEDDRQMRIFVDIYNPDTDESTTVSTGWFTAYIDNSDAPVVELPAINISETLFGGSDVGIEGWEACEVKLRWEWVSGNGGILWRYYDFENNQIVAEEQEYYPIGDTDKYYTE